MIMIISHLCTLAMAIRAMQPVSPPEHWDSASPEGPQWEGCVRKRRCDWTATVLAPVHGRSYCLSWVFPSDSAGCRLVLKGRGGHGRHCGRGVLPVCRCYTDGAAFPVCLVAGAHPCLLVTWRQNLRKKRTNKLGKFNCSNCSKKERKSFTADITFWKWNPSLINKLKLTKMKRETDRHR